MRVRYITDTTQTEGCAEESANREMFSINTAVTGSRPLNLETPLTVTPEDQSYWYVSPCN